MRFRKSIKICKGVRVNFSKSGASATFGTKGVSINVGKKGTYLNTGIPGTGLYDRQRIGGGSSVSPKRNTTTSHTISETINLKLDDNGIITFYDSVGNMINDPSKIRKIKATSAFKAERERMMKVKFDEINDENEEFVNIYKLTPNVHNEKAYLNNLEKVVLKKYKKKPYSEAKPTETQIKEILMSEANKKIKTWRFWAVAKERRIYVEENFDLRFTEAIGKWQQAKEAFEKQQEQQETVKNEEYLSEYNNARENITMALEGDLEYIESTIEIWLSSVTLPVEFGLQFDYSDNILHIDLDLPEIEDLPQEKAVMLANGTTKKKKKTQKELKEDYINCIFGLAMFFSANLFNISPRIEKIVISGYTQRSNTTVTEAKDEYVYSIKFIRSVFEKEKTTNKKKPLDFCLSFENRCNITSTLILKKIEPFEKSV